MIGFKGLILKTAVTSQAFEGVVKKADQFRKLCQLLVDFYADIAKLEEMRGNCNMKVMGQTSNGEYTDPYHNNIITTLTKLSTPQKSLQQTSKKTCTDMTTLLFQTFNKITASISRLQQSIQQYQQIEEVVSEQSKKYYKAHRNMLAAIQMYKDSFSDVNLIYNMDEKTRRYENCWVLFRGVQGMFRGLADKCDELYNKKKQVANQYDHLVQQFQLALKTISDTSVTKTEQLTKSITQTSQTSQQILQQCNSSSSKLKFQSLFTDIFDISKLAYFQQNELINRNKQLPLILLYHNLLKEEHLGLFNVEVMAYLKLVEDRLKVKRHENRKVYDAVTLFFKNMEKIFNSGLRWLLVNFEKKRKALAQCFGNRLVTFLKALTSIFQVSVGLNEKLIATAAPILQSIQANINQDQKLSKYFSQQINTNVQRFFIKRDTKKLTQTKQESESRATELRLIRKQMGQKAEFIKHIVCGFQEKIDANSIKLMKNYHGLITAVKATTDQFHSICQEYLDVYFGAKERSANLEKYYADFSLTRTKNKQAYNTLLISGVKKDLGPITFDGQFSKIEDFKKLKKPFKIESQSLDLSKLEQRSQKYSASMDEDKSISIGTKSQKSIRNLTDNEQQTKNAQFLIKKITFKQNEKLVKTYSCALAQKIILQGKIFITTQRICFHSKFNSSNIFFGRTFIQFPKIDIKKIDKRKMTMLLDNSISFTTLNGQIIFTSFFSRDEAYDLICRTFNFNIDDEVYEYQEREVEELPEFLIDLEENDDLKFSSIQSRKQAIEKLLSNYDYLEAANIEFTEEGLNAFKLFKLFYANNEIVMNNRKYESYLKYVKECLNHKNLQISQWDPLLSVFFNKSNLKESAPISTKRKIVMTVPVSSSGVPFMPKTAQSTESQTLYFESKHKLIMESTIETTGAPYTDTFQVNLKSVVESDQDGKCKVTMKYYINFIKNTMMKNVIQTKTKQQTLNASKIWVNSMRKYFQTLHSKPKPSQAKKTVEQVTTELENVQRQLEAKQEQNQNLGVKIGELLIAQKKYKAAIIALVVINLITILIHL